MGQTKNTSSTVAPPDFVAPPRIGSRARYGIAVLLLTMTAINYLDRTNLSVALPYIKDDLHLSATQMGIALSAFSWVYALLQIPGGFVVGKIGPKLSYGVALVGWSLCTITMITARSFGAVVGLRVALGVCETPTFPATNQLATNWFPSKERGRAVSIYVSGQYVALAAALPGLTLLITNFGWRSVFVVTGVLGLVFSVIWFRAVYNTPRDSPRVSEQEAAYIEDAEWEAPEADSVTDSGPPKSTWADFKYLMSQRRLLGLYVGQFATGTVLFFFLTWFPTYLIEAKHLGAIKAGFFGSLPYLSALAGALTAGQVSDWLLRRGMSPNLARKAPVITGFALASVIFTANFTNSPALVITIMSVAFFAQGLTQMNLAIIADVAPRRLVGLTGGIGSFFANAAGILTPLIIGWTVDATGSYSVGIAYVAAVAILGLLSYLFIIDRVARLHA
jgi:ACS family D-galactonate transporter-like MFS transporter